jgi:hypothetical protein
LASGTAVAIVVVVVARTLMTVTRSQSLASGPLLARIAVCAVGSLLVASVLIDWRGLVPIVSRVRRRGAEALPPGSARR